MHDGSSNTTTTATITIDAESRAVWDADYAWSFNYARGRQPCDYCARHGATADCGDCGGTGFHSGEEPTFTVGDVASIHADEIENAVGKLAEVVTTCRAALERHAEGRPLLNYCPPEAVALVAELEAIGPCLGRAVVLCRMLADVCEAHEENDPRVAIREHQVAIADARHGQPLHVNRFSTLSDLVALVAACGCEVATIDFTPSAYDGYLAAREAQTAEDNIAFSAALRDQCHCDVEVRLLDESGAPVVTDNDEAGDDTRSASSGDAE
jgi:hypothetical protein